MDIRINIHAEESLKETVKEIASFNIEKKINRYLEKFNKQNDVQGTIELFIEKNKKGLFNGKLHIQIDGEVFHYEREDYKNLDDLIHHLFDHFKESVSQEY